MILLTPDEFKKTIAEAVKDGIELYKASQDVQSEKDGKAPVVVRDLATERGYHFDTFLKIVKDNDIVKIKSKPVTIEARNLHYFPKKRTA